MFGAEQVARHAFFFDQNAALMSSESESKQLTATEYGS